MGDVLSGWVSAPAAVRAEDAEVRPGAGIVLVVALVLMALPAAIGLLVLLGRLG